MKKILILISLTTCLTSYGQTVDSIKYEGNTVAIERFSETFREILFVISLDQQTIQVKQGEIFNDSIKLKPEWILSMNILRGQAAIDQYGDRGKNGVVIIELEKESLNSLSAEMKRKLTAYKN